MRHSLSHLALLPTNHDHQRLRDGALSSAAELFSWLILRLFLFLLLDDAADIQASLHFCSECNNMLFPKADAQRRVMVLACRCCPYEEMGDNQLVYRNDLLTVTKYASMSDCTEPSLTAFCRASGKRWALRRTSARTPRWYARSDSLAYVHIH